MLHAMMLKDRVEAILMHKVCDVLCCDICNELTVILVFVGMARCAIDNSKFFSYILVSFCFSLVICLVVCSYCLSWLKLRLRQQCLN